MQISRHELKPIPDHAKAKIPKLVGEKKTTDLVKNLNTWAEVNYTEFNYIVKITYKHSRPLHMGQVNFGSCEVQRLTWA